MKKIALIVGIILGFSLFANAQVNPKALGLRLGGDGDINGAEISYQHGLSESNRLEFDLGLGGNDHHNRLYLFGLYHWVENINEGLNWYYGAGGNVGFFEYEENDDYINIGISGQIGLEYDFSDLNVPLLLSIDFRPGLDIVGDNAGLGWGTSLGIRYLW